MPNEIAYAFDPCLPVLGVGAYEHRFGGVHSIKGATCCNCDKPLLQYFSLDTRDPLVDLHHQPDHLALMYCMRCALCWYNFSYRMVQPTAIEIIEANVGERTWEDWYPEMGDVFDERRVVLNPLDKSIQRILDKANKNLELSSAERSRCLRALGWPESKSLDCFNQIGGRSFLVQRLKDPPCPCCDNSTMRFLASLCNDERLQVHLAPRGMAAQIVFFVCVKCGTLTVQHSI